MGYYTYKGITYFEPDNTEKKLYIEMGYSTMDAMDMLASAKAHFGEQIELEDLTIECEYIHTDCLCYDMYDSSDWKTFLILNLKDKS